MVDSRFAVIVPCYNEGSRLKVRELLDFCLKYKEFDFYFVNDGSTDNTEKILVNNFSELPNATIFNNHKNLGKGETIRKAINAIECKKYNYYGFIDADLEIPLAHLLKLYNTTLDSNALLGLTYRDEAYSVKSKVPRYLGNKIIKIISSFILKYDQTIEDTQCGCKIFSSKITHIFKQPFISSWLFDIELLLRLRDFPGTISGKITTTRLSRLDFAESNSSFNLKSGMQLLKELYKINNIYN